MRVRVAKKIIAQHTANNRHGTFLKATNRLKMTGQERATAWLQRISRKYVLIGDAQRALDAITQLYEHRAGLVAMMTQTNMELAS